MPNDVVQLAQTLIATPSVNPMGEPSAADACESALTDQLAALFEELNLPYVRQTVHPRRENILVRLEGDPAVDRLVLWDTHQDTVPVDGMTIDPFDAQVRDGKLFGRGACDEKGVMAAMICALERLAEDRPAGMPTIVLACTVNEESGFTGASAIADLWNDGSCELLPRQPDAVLVAEPTELNVVVAHKGVVRWHCHVLGRAAHSSSPNEGINAIFAMRHVMEALEHYGNNVAPTIADHALCGKPTLNVGTIQGGISVNTVPDRATISIDRRICPGESPAEARDAVIEYIAEHVPSDVRIEHDPSFLTALGLNDENNADLASQVADAARSVTGRCESIGVPFGTDASAYAAAGVPTVVFGPGSIAQAHTADEWISIDQLRQAEEIFYQLGRSVS